MYCLKRIKKIMGWLPFILLFKSAFATSTPLYFINASTSNVTVIPLSPQSAATQNQPSVTIKINENDSTAKESAMNLPTGTTNYLYPYLFLGNDKNIPSIVIYQNTSQNAYWWNGQTDFGGYRSIIGPVIMPYPNLFLNNFYGAINQNAVTGYNGSFDYENPDPANQATAIYYYSSHFYLGKENFLSSNTSQYPYMVPMKTNFYCYGEMNSYTGCEAPYTYQDYTDPYYLYLIYWQAQPMSFEITNLTGPIKPSELNPYPYPIYRIKISTPIMVIGYNIDRYPFDLRDPQFQSQYYFHFKQTIKVYGVKNNQRDFLGYLMPNTGVSFTWCWTSKNTNICPGPETYYPMTTLSPQYAPSGPTKPYIQFLAMYTLGSKDKLLNSKTEYDATFYYQATSDATNYDALVVQVCVFPKTNSNAVNNCVEEQTENLASIPTPFQMATKNNWKIPDDNNPITLNMEAEYGNGVNQTCLVGNGMAQKSLYASIIMADGSIVPITGSSYSWMYDYIYFLSYDGTLITNLYQSQQDGFFSINDEKGPFTMDNKTVDIIQSSTNCPIGNNSITPTKLFYMSGKAATQSVAMALPQIVLNSGGNAQNAIIASCGENNINCDNTNSVINVLSNNQYISANPSMPSIRLAVFVTNNQSIYLPADNPNWLGISYFYYPLPTETDEPGVMIMSQYFTIAYRVTPIASSGYSTISVYPYHIVNYAGQLSLQPINSQYNSQMPNIGNNDCQNFGYGVYVDTYGNPLYLDETQPCQ